MIVKLLFPGLLECSLGRSDYVDALDLAGCSLFDAVYGAYGFFGCVLALGVD